MHTLGPILAARFRVPEQRKTLQMRLSSTRVDWLILQLTSVIHVHALPSVVVGAVGLLQCV